MRSFTNHRSPALAQCASRHTVRGADGKPLRLQCERSAWPGERFCRGPHRTEAGPPVTGPDHVTRAQVVSWP